MANFIRRVVDHLLNQVLVEGLANSRWFQRFAVSSNEMLKKMQASGKEGGATLDQHFSSFSKSAKEAAEKFRKEFNEELSKVQAKQNATSATQKETFKK